MRRVVEQQRDRFVVDGDLEKLNLVVRRRVADTLHKVSRSGTDGDLRRTLLPGNRSFDQSVDLIRQRAAVFKILRHDLNRCCMIVGRQQN